MRTVIGMYTYRAKLNQYQQEEVDFKHRFYVAEEDLITGIQHD